MQPAYQFRILAIALVHLVAIATASAQTNERQSQHPSNQPIVYDRTLIPDRDPPEGFTGEPRGSCGNVVYEDAITTGTGAQQPIWNGNDANFPWIYCGDDITLAGTDRFVCGFLVRLGTGDIAATPGYDYTFEFWDVAGTNVCPDNGATMLYRSASQFASGFAGSGMSIPFSTVIDPAVRVPNFLWVIFRTSIQNTNPYVRFRTDSQNPDVGDTSDWWYVGYNNDRCDDPAHFLIYTGPQNVGFAIKLLANQGPSGSCCNQQTGACTDNVNLGNCSAYYQAWNPSPGCPQGCSVCNVSCQGATVLENEPSCATNYVDTTDNGCAYAQGSLSFIDISCGADVCGTTGVYSFTNGTVTQYRRDNDYYRLTLTTSSLITWSVAGAAAMQAQILIPRLGPGSNPCSDAFSIDPGAAAFASSTRGCESAIATACLPPGTYYLVARPDSFFPIPCGINYRATLACAPCTLPTGACCLPTVCKIYEYIRCLQQGGAYFGDNSVCEMINCPSPPTNETCSTSAALTGSKTIEFDTTLAVSEVPSISLCGPIYKDIWFDYRPRAEDFPQFPGITEGGVVVSTYGTCFDTKIEAYEVNQTIYCTQSQQTQCAHLNQQYNACNDDMNSAMGNTASYNGYGVSIGGCYKIRVGSAEASQGGPGFLRVDFLPLLPNPPWEGGRCCMPDGNCSNQWTAADCSSLGGYFTIEVSFDEGLSIAGVGCNSIPCPAAGEACYNALDLNSILGGNGFGTTTRAIVNKLYNRYLIPTPSAPGSGLTISTCGSNFDTALAIYSTFDASSGQCTGTTLARNNNCTPAEPSAAGAQNIATCFTTGTSDSCLCMTVGNTGQATGPGSTIYIEVGAANTITGSTNPTMDPVPQNCGQPVIASLTITPSARCSVCEITSCPSGSTAENEPVCGAEYIDTTNAGCSGNTPVFKNITCNQQICGKSGTYLVNQVQSRDMDWYRIIVTSVRTLHISVDSSFPLELQLLAAHNPSNICDVSNVASTISLTSCLRSELTQPVCADTYYIVVAPAISEDVPCGSDYVIQVSCSPAPVPVCCKGDANNDGLRNGADISVFVNTLINAPQLSVNGCIAPITCRSDFNGDYAVTPADIPGFVTAMLSTLNCP